MLNKLKEIQLSNSDLKTIVDEEDYELLNKYRWYLSKRGDVVTSMNFGYKVNRQVKIHRFIMNINDPKTQVDHIDGSRLNNSRQNLRLVSNKINTRNRHRKLLSTSSKYFGVTLDKRGNLSKRWIAQIKVDYKHIFLGRYKTENEAALAYNSVAEKYGFLTRNLI